MKIYVITKGEYSDYSIYGATTNREEAERYVKCWNEYNGNDMWYKMEIEEYDSDTISSFLCGHRRYTVVFNSRLEWKRTIDANDYEYGDPLKKVTQINSGEFFVYVETNRGEEVAKKIAEDKLMEYVRKETLKNG